MHDNISARSVDVIPGTALEAYVLHKLQGQKDK